MKAHPNTDPTDMNEEPSGQGQNQRNAIEMTNGIDDSSCHSVIEQAKYSVEEWTGFLSH